MAASAGPPEEEENRQKASIPTPSRHAPELEGHAAGPGVVDVEVKARLKGLRDQVFGTGELADMILMLLHDDLAEDAWRADAMYGQYQAGMLARSALRTLLRLCLVDKSLKNAVNGCERLQGALARSDTDTNFVGLRYDLATVPAINEELNFLDQYVFPHRKMTCRRRFGDLRDFMRPARGDLVTLKIRLPSRDGTLDEFLNDLANARWPDVKRAYLCLSIPPLLKIDVWAHEVTPRMPLVGTTMLGEIGKWFADVLQDARENSEGEGMTQTARVIECWASRSPLADCGSRVLGCAVPER